MEWAPRYDPSVVYGVRVREFHGGAGRYMCHNMSHQYLSMVLITGPALITTLTLVRVPQPHR